MPQRRLYYAVTSLALTPDGVANPTATHFAHGVQSVGVNTTFNLEEIFELGQLEIYEQVENIPNIELTAEKVIDGFPMLYQLATRGAVDTTLGGRSNVRSIGYLNTFDDNYDNASGVPQARCQMSGLLVGSINYTFDAEQGCRESLTLVGNHKVWQTAGLTAVPLIFNGLDVPGSIGASGGVQRRQHILFRPITGGVGSSFDANGYVDNNRMTILPNIIDGISQSGTNDLDSTNFYASKVQSISVSADLGRTELFQLGHRTPYFRFAQFPLPVNCEITTYGLTDLDGVSATEEGVLGNGNNLSNASIRIRLRDGAFFDLGTKNKLNNTTIGGGDTGGGNVTISYSFQNFNKLNVASPYDCTPSLQINAP